MAKFWPDFLFIIDPATRIFKRGGLDKTAGILVMCANSDSTSRRRDSSPAQDSFNTAPRRLSWVSSTRLKILSILAQRSSIGFSAHLAQQPRLGQSPIT